MFERRAASTSLSAEVIQYFRKQGHKQSEIAHLLGVSEGFISLVKSKERSLTLDHLGRLAEAMSVPLGAFLIAVTEPKRGVKADRKLLAATERIMRQGDVAVAAIMRAQSVART
jgi:transcriptional regulator with XRE-family HTH domain